MTADRQPEPPPSSALQNVEDQEERTDVTHLHAAIEREPGEPEEGREPLSLWVVVLMGSLLFWGGFYLQRYSGGFKPLSYNEHSGGLPVAAAPAGPVDMFALGKRLYGDTCGKCHQNDGKGVAGQYPPLAGSDWVLTPGTARMIRIVLDGLQGPIQVNGVTYNNQMVPWRDVLTDQQIAAILTYIRGEKAWGNSAAPVTPEEVAAIRQKTSGRPAQGAWTAPELLALPEVEPLPAGATNAPAGGTNAPGKG